jgi:hypothetical protein
MTLPHCNFDTKQSFCYCRVNMAAPFARCTKAEKCAMIYFWGLKGYQGQKSIKDIQHYMRTVLVYDWTDQFKNSITGVTDAE